MESRQIDSSDISVQVRISSAWRNTLMRIRSETGKNMRELIETALEEVFGYYND